jgi:Tfp pilus assembly protein PilF
MKKARNQQLKTQAQQLMSQDRFDEARPLMMQFCKRNPRDPEGWCMLGAIHGQTGAYTKAETCAHKALKFAPAFQYAFSVLGNALQAQDKYPEAIKTYRRAIRITGSSPSLLINMGIALTETTGYEEAESWFCKALESSPGNTLAQYNYAVLLTRLARFNESLTLYEQVLEKQPALADAHWDYSCLLLMMGRLDKGWKEYEWRWQSKEFTPRNLPYRPWNGSPIEGKKVLIYAEQGIGDEVMFASCLPDLAAMHADITVECDTRLEPVFSRSIEGIHFHGTSNRDDHDWLSTQTPFDWQIAMGSLPGFSRPDIESFPLTPSFLRADSNLLEKWQLRLEALGTGLKVGISWRGGKSSRISGIRSIPLENWLPLFRVDGIHCVNLQYGDQEREIRQFCDKSQAQLHDWSDFNQMSDIDDLVALISNLDLVISIDNSTVHFAGSLGIPVWNILCVRPDWRWGLDNDNSYWYPTMRLIRQSTSGCWDDVIATVEQLLSDRAGRDSICGE